MTQSNNIFARLASAPDKRVWLINYFKYKQRKFLNGRTNIHSGVPKEFGPARFKVINSNGLDLLLDSQSLVDKSILNYGGWESSQIELLLNAALRLSRTMPVTFFDIGAYWGLYSLRAIKSGLNHVVAFEPDPTNYAQLLSQLFLNDAVNKVTVHHFALSSSDKELAFKPDFYGDGNRGTSRLVGEEVPSSTQVKARSFDNLYPDFSTCIVGKIDVEGHQIEVISGMRGAIERNPVFLQVEVEDHALKSFEAVARSLGLRRCGVIDVDHYYTNIDSAITESILSSSECVVRVRS